MKVFISHPVYRDNQRTVLKSDVASGSTALAVKNSAGFQNSKYILLGRPGGEQTEIVDPQTIGGNESITLASGTKFKHVAETPVIAIDYDKIKIYRSINGIAGTYDLLDTIDIQPDSDSTPYEDVGSLPTYYYKFSYVNSGNGAEDDLSDPIAATGFVFYSLKTLIDRVLSLAGDAKAELATRDEVRDWLNEFLEFAQQELAVITRRSPILIHEFDLEKDRASYPAPSDFLVEKALKFSNNGGVTYDKNGAHLGIDHTGSVVQDNIAFGYSIVNDQIIFDPKPTTDNWKCKIYYVGKPTTLLLQTDALPTVFANSSHMFVKNGLSMYSLKDGDLDAYKTLRSNARTGLRDFLSFYKRMQNNHVEFTQLSTAMS